MGKGRRRRSFSDSSDLESDSGLSADGDEEGRQSNSASDQEADNWVLCDRCTKWRRIPASFVDQIKEDVPWYCEHNPNKAFASCSVPQELTNEEIDAAADSDGAGESEHDEESFKRRRIPAVWQLLKDNVLPHRKRKVQDEDDIMICHCKPTWRGGDGCGPDCINRMLCIECVPGFCPSEDRCTNQMFSKRMYANLEIRRAGAKGFGLFALEDIKAGQFIIEYIGEVLEEDEYQRRKDYYMSVGQRHYYFMNIGNGEVIDACRKGNISRFINHSCEPNCETQKWLVRGELAIGLFAVRDIPKDTELTFDYNFERYGDKPMRCYCRSTNCRKFIGGMQDNYDVSLLPPVEPDDASHDLPPIMLTDSDMDPNMRMLLDWRVGVKVDKAKELGMVTRLERVCKARNVTWTVKHFYGQEPLPAAQEQQPRPQPESVASAPSISGQGSGADKPERQAIAEAATGVATAKQKQQQQHQQLPPRKAEKPIMASSAPGASAGTNVKGKASGTSTAKQSETSAGLSKLRLEDGGGNTTPAPGAASAGHGARNAVAPAPSSTPEVAQVRGPKALFKQWKIMQQQDPVPTPVVEEKPAATPSSPPSPQSQHSPPSPLSPPSPRSSLSLDNDDDALDEARNAAAEAAKHVPLRKRLRRLLPRPPVTATEGGAERTENGGASAGTASAVGAAAAAAGAAKRNGVDGSGPGTNGTTPGAAAQGSSSGGVARKNSLGSGGAPPASAAAGLSYSPPRSTSPPPSAIRSGGGAGAGGGGNRRLRSEIDRRLEEVVGGNGRLKDPSRQNVIKVLRLFNLCDISCGHSGRGNGFGSAAGGRYLNGGRNGDDLGLPGPGTGSTAGGLTARQRARMADLSLLLDVILKTTSSAAKKELVVCGLLTQLHQATVRNTGKEYCVILRKVLRVVEGLPLDANDVYAVRSAHGNFADMLRQLSSNADYDVRTKAAALLKKFPPSAVTDQRLLQLMAAPPVRFGHGRGGGGAGGGGGGSRHAPYSSAGGGGGSSGMMMFTMQQQMLQQQQLLKQQHMLRMKDGAAGGSGALPPPPPLPSGDGAADGAAAAPSLHRTSSMTSLDEESMDVDQGGQTGPSGLPPLGPGRQRNLAVAAATAAAFASRPGLLRPMMPRTGTPGMAGSMANGMGTMGMSAGAAGRGGAMGALGMGPSPLGLPPRPPSPANLDLYCSYNGAADDGPYTANKRRKFSHPHGQDGDSLPGPPPRPPYSLASSAHHPHPYHSYLGLSACRRSDGTDGNDRDHTGGPSSSDLPLPPPHPQHGYGYSSSPFVNSHNSWPGPRASSEERDPGPELPERLSAEQLFGLLQRPLQRPPPLPPLQGHIQPERHVHGQLTDVVVLFALGLYGSFGRPDAAVEAKAVDAEGARADDEPVCWSPILSPSGPPMSPIVEPALAAPAAAAPSTAVGTASAVELPLPPPPPPLSGGTASGATPWEGTQLRPLRTQPTMASGANAAGPSPYRPHGSPSPYGGWDSAPGAAVHGPGSTASTPTVSGFGPGAQLGGGAGGVGGFQLPVSAPNSATAAAAGGVGGASAGLPPVVHISSLSDWRLPPPPPSAGGMGPDRATARASPHPSPEPQSGAGGAAVRSHGAEAENIDEWLRPVSMHHAEVWEEPDSFFEAFVADMVRHRLGKYMQPEHPSRVSVQEATALRAKVYREVVAKERRAWEERRSAGVYKPIERHKLEANLKEFVRSTIKRMRDREKEKATAAGGGGPAAAGTVTHSQQGAGPPLGSRGTARGQGGGAAISPGQPQQHHQPQSGPHNAQRQSLTGAHGQTPPPHASPAPQSTDAGAPPPPQQPSFGHPRPSPSPDAACDGPGTAPSGLPAVSRDGQEGSQAAGQSLAGASEETRNGITLEPPAVLGPEAAFAGGCGGVAGAGDVAMTEATAA